MSDSKHIGYLSLTSPQRVLCHDCARIEKVAYPAWCKLFDVNVDCYWQSCHRCGKRIHQGRTPAWCELYPDVSDQIVPDLPSSFDPSRDDRVDILPSLMTMTFSAAVYYDAVRVCDIHHPPYGGNGSLHVHGAAFSSPEVGVLKHDGPEVRRCFAMRRALRTITMPAWPNMSARQTGQTLKQEDKTCSS